MYNTVAFSATASLAHAGVHRLLQYAEWTDQLAGVI
jgi:hypothetical protein